MTWRSVTAALLAWARYRLDRGQGSVRSTSDFGGTGGGAAHERGAQITDGYDRVVEVERAVLATFEARHGRLAALEVATCRRIFLALTVGKRIAKRIDAAKRRREAEDALTMRCLACGGTGRGRLALDAAPHESLRARKKRGAVADAVERCTLCDGRGTVAHPPSVGHKRKPGEGLLLSVTDDYRQIAKDTNVDEQVAALIVRVGLGQVRDAPAARGLVPEPRRKESRMAAPKRRRIEQSHLLSGWKEIGRYINRDARTARRWAKRGMPIMRDPYGWPLANPAAIDAWRTGGTAK